MFEIKNVDKYYNKRGSNQIHVLDNVTLSLPSSGLVAIYGISGCGKTTLLNVLGGIDTFSGSITLDGEKITPSTADNIRNKYVSYIFQNYNLDQNSTVYENVRMALKLAGITDEEEQKSRILSALSAVDIEKFKNRYPSSLSGGQQQRVAIARAIAKAPRVILADEPTGNLDEANTFVVMDILKQLSQDRLVLVVTHESEIVEHYCDLVINLGDGKVLSVEENIPDIDFVAGDSRKIYLGDLSKDDISAGSVGIELFTDGTGNSSETPSLRIVHIKGKTYLQTLDESIKIIDNRSELKLVNTTAEAEKKARSAKKFDLSELPPVHGKKLGKAFGFLESVREGYRHTLKGQKFGKKLLIGALTVFAFAIVFTISSTGTIFYSLKSEMRAISDKVFYVSVSSSNDIAAVKGAVSTGAEVHLHDTWESEISNYNALTYHYFTERGFESGDFGSLGIQAYSTTLGARGESKLLYGSLPKDKEKGVVISSSLAEYILGESEYSFLKDYTQILHLLCDNYPVTGIVEEEGFIVYYRDGYFEEMTVMNNFNTRKASSYNLGKTPEKGHVLVGLIDYGYTGDYENGLKAGDTITIGEITFIFDGYVKISSSDAYIFENYYSGGPVYGYKDTDYYYYGGETYFVSDADFETLANSVRVYGVRHVTVFTQELKNDIKEVAKVLPHSAVTTPDDLREIVRINLSGDIAAAATTIVVMIFVLGLCLYLIMRTSMMSRIKEIGIYRVIGASKKNMLYKFFAETILVTTLTVFIGYLASSYFVTQLASLSVHTSEIAYYPAWLALSTLALLYALSLVAGLLPARALLKKTPAAILSAYDI
ncbi:MAG: ABC transporter ATP-binding protein/permease [Eubacteriales bacterium]